MQYLILVVVFIAAITNAFGATKLTVFDVDGGPRQIAAMITPTVISLHSTI